MPLPCCALRSKAFAPPCLAMRGGASPLLCSARHVAALLFGAFAWPCLAWLCPLQCTASLRFALLCFASAAHRYALPLHCEAMVCVALALPCGTQPCPCWASLCPAFASPSPSSRRLAQPLLRIAARSFEPHCLCCAPHCGALPSHRAAPLRLAMPLLSDAKH